jgi:hypothetical protein
MSKFGLSLLIVILAFPVSPTPAQSLYYPGAGNDWEVRKPEDVGMDSAALEAAIAFARTNETRMPRELTSRGRDSQDPYDAILGPQKDRAPINGIILRQGYIVGEWGETKRVDMTFSVTKSFVSTLAGLALDRGLIQDVNHMVKDYVDDGGFDSAQNSKITWNQLLNQTSEWQGTLWNKPDWAHSRPNENPATWPNRKPGEPGSRWEYNDVRVNRLALALLRVWRRPLPQVFREYVMDPIGASRSWEWHGYENSWVTIDGMRMQSVSGGGHWGGGMWINARDMARFGLLSIRNGRWKERQILSEKWIRMAKTPTVLNPNYGYMNWFLNTNRKEWPSVPDTTFCHIGAGTNAICAIPEYDIVAVVRWIETSKLDGFLQRVIASAKTARR